MADYQLRARIPHELADSISEIVETINTTVPGAEATISTVARYALNDYVRRFHPRVDGSTLFVELPIKGLSTEQMESVLSALNTLHAIDPVADSVAQAKQKVESDLLSAEIQVLMAKRK